MLLTLPDPPMALAFGSLIAFVVALAGVWLYVSQPANNPCGPCQSVGPGDMAWWIFMCWAC